MGNFYCSIAMLFAKIQSKVVQQQQFSVVMVLHIFQVYVRSLSTHTLYSTESLVTPTWPKKRNQKHTFQCWMALHMFSVVNTLGLDVKVTHVVQSAKTVLPEGPWHHWSGCKYLQGVKWPVFKRCLSSPLGKKKKQQPDNKNKNKATTPHFKVAFKNVILIPKQQIHFPI